MRSVDTLSLSPSLSQIDHKRLKQSIMMNILYRNTAPYILFCRAVQFSTPSSLPVLAPQWWVVRGLFHQFYHSGRASELEIVGVPTLHIPHHFGLCPPARESLSIILPWLEKRRMVNDITEMFEYFILIFTWFPNNFGCWRLSHIATGFINNIAVWISVLFLYLIVVISERNFVEMHPARGGWAWAGTSVLNLLKTKVYLVCKFSPRSRNNMQL